MNGETKDWKPGGEPDEHHGAGGTYVVKDGKRVLVEDSRTDLNPEVVIDPETGHRRLKKDGAVQLTARPDAKEKE